MSAPGTLAEWRWLRNEVTLGPWSDLRVGRDNGHGPRAYEAQLCNASGVAVFIVTHDGSAEGRANVALARAAPALLAEVERLRAVLTEIADVDKRRAEFVVEGPRGFARMCALAKAALEPQ